MKRGNYLRGYAAALAYEKELRDCGFHVRGKLRLLAENVGDPDAGDHRGDGSRGWKAHKHRHQWEHGAIEREKHERARARKAERRGRRRR